MYCHGCPRNCQIDRANQIGFCGESTIRVAKIIENFHWEEPCISGEKGALAIFFSGCNLRCSFCQNYAISHEGKGTRYQPKEFAQLLKQYDLNNFSVIDLITPSHFSDALTEALADFNSPIPIVWNSNGYETVRQINRVSRFVDVFLVDLKYYDAKLSERLSGAADYFSVASQAVLEMSRLKKNVFQNNMMTQGVLIRHLVLPGETRDSLQVLDFIREQIPDPHISLMSQFTPIGQGEKTRKLYPLEFKTVLTHAEKLGLLNGYFQELTSADCNFIPDF